LGKHSSVEHAFLVDYNIMYVFRCSPSMSNILPRLSLIIGMESVECIVVPLMLNRRVTTNPFHCPKSLSNRSNEIRFSCICGSHYDHSQWFNLFARVILFDFVFRLVFENLLNLCLHIYHHHSDLYPKMKLLAFMRSSLEYRCHPLLIQLWFLSIS
jgi:hypothetical protein